MEDIDFITINEKFSNLDKSLTELDNSIKKAKEGLNIE